MMFCVFTKAAVVTVPNPVKVSYNLIILFSYDNVKF